MVSDGDDDNDDDDADDINKLTTAEKTLSRLFQGPIINNIHEQSRYICSIHIMSCIFICFVYTLYKIIGFKIFKIVIEEKQ